MNPIYLLEARFTADLGYKHTELMEYHWYFTNFSDAELHIPIFQDVAIRQFRIRWKLDEAGNDFECEIKIKEKQKYEQKEDSH